MHSHMTYLISEPRRILTYKPLTMGYIFAADSVYRSPCILKQSCLKTRASMLNDSTRKTVFNAKWLFGSFKVVCFDVDEKPLGDYILRRNNVGLRYELWNDIGTARSKCHRRPHSHLIPLFSEPPRISA